MDTKVLRYFKAIVGYGSFSKAAAHLRIAQPALSRHVQKLEHGLGCQLLRRAARGVTPTEAGKALLRRASKFEQEFEELRLEMAGYAERGAGVLRVAVQSPLSLVMVPELFREFQASHPGVELELTEGFSGDLIDGLLDASIDLAIADMPSHPHADLNCSQLWIEALQLVGPAGGLCAGRFGKGPLPLREVAELPVIMPCRRHAIRRLIDAAFERQHLRFRPVIEANGALMILQMVKAGLGYTLMPNNGVFPWIASGELQAVGIRPALRRTMSVIVRTAVLGDPSVISFRNLVLSLSPKIAKKERFGPAALFLGESSLSRPVAMPNGHGLQVVPALAQGRLGS